MRKYTILLVEDEKIEAMDIKVRLESLGFNVPHIAATGEEAVEKAIILKPDLILMDINLKGDMDGIEAAKLIKNLQLPVIYITSHSDEATIQKALVGEPYGYLIKPIDDKKMKLSVEVAINKNQMERKFKKSQETFYQTIFENSGTATAISEEDMVLSRINTQFTVLTGYLKEEIERKKKFTEFFPKKDHEKIKEYYNIRQIDPDSAPKNYETTLITKDKNERKVNLTVARIPGTKKSVISILNITKLRKAEDDTKESQEKYKGIFDNAPEAIILFDRKGKILEANDKIEEISGFKKEELIGKNFVKLLPKVEIECRKAFLAFKNLISNKERQDLEWTIINKQGREVHFIAHPSLIKKEDKIQGLIIILEDITKRKNTEINLKRSLDERGLLIREIHHRVKNNMQVISSILSLQRMHVKDEETAVMLRECQGRVRSMAMIHEKLYQSPDMGHINFKIYITNLLGHIQESCAPKDNSIQIDVDVDNVEMSIETAMPCGLIVNELVSNSLKYAFPHKKGSILVKLKKEENYILTVADDGIGIPENINPENTNQLGLKVVKTLTGQLGSTMQLDRTSGTSFTFEFQELNYKKRL
ncbi:MAG TPA: PAS domain S-box protein [Methanobacteriaceae archaeon]|nr:PAS domain S-box protein [Methanobacteriaceae archaeon]